MSVYVSLFLVVFMTGVIVVFVYRWLANARSFTRIEIDGSALAAWVSRKIRQGLKMLDPANRERVKQVKLRTPKDGFKTPWGW